MGFDGPQIRLGVSACLLGEKVRYDGGHKRDGFIVDELGRIAELVPVCPEKECGLGVPREPIQLEGDPTDPRLVAVQTRRDLTEQMQTWCSRRIRELESEGLAGFIFKSRSPSCGVDGVEVYPSPEGPAERTGVGLFARALMTRFPRLPVAGDDQLHDITLRERFVERLPR